jgi:hypothetical protein
MKVLRAHLARPGHPARILLGPAEVLSGARLFAS